jgi:hypothetical protein
MPVFILKKKTVKVIPVDEHWQVLKLRIAEF